MAVVARSIGVVFLVPGILLVFGGLVTAVFGWSAMDQALDDGIDATSKARAETAAYLSVTGLAGTGFGAVLATVGGLMVGVRGPSLDRAAWLRSA